jgi:hypothetical protein
LQEPAFSTTPLDCSNQGEVRRWLQAFIAGTSQLSADEALRRSSVRHLGVQLRLPRRMDGRTDRQTDRG